MCISSTLSCYTCDLDICNVTDDITNKHLMLDLTTLNCTLHYVSYFFFINKINERRQIGKKHILVHAKYFVSQVLFTLGMLFLLYMLLSHSFLIVIIIIIFFFIIFIYTLLNRHRLVFFVIIFATIIAIDFFHFIVVKFLSLFTVIRMHFRILCQACLWSWCLCWCS